jgi:hypothetical protein
MAVRLVSNEQSRKEEFHDGLDQVKAHLGRSPEVVAEKQRRDTAERHN